MHTLSDLSSLDLTELKAIAVSMGIKKIDDLSQDDLIYTILDQQAINSSKASAANITERKKRPTKQKAKAKTSQNAKAENSNDADNAGSKQTADSAEKKNGQPKRSKKQTKDAAAEQNGDSTDALQSGNNETATAQADGQNKQRKRTFAEWQRDWP